jgi:Zn-dependent protease with chaperone function
MCWPAGAAGAFFSAVLIMDIAQKDYASLPFHGILAVCVTGILWLLCELIGQPLTLAVLVIPLIFASIFLFTVWFMNESMKKRGCCMTCGEAGKPRLVKRETQKGPSPTMIGLVDSGKGYEKQNVFITAGTPTLLVEAVEAQVEEI